MAWLYRRERQAAARYMRLFREARRQFDLEVKTIFARHAADGHLLSGYTVKAVVRALDHATVKVIADALAGIAAVTDHAGAQRKRLITELAEQLAMHHVDIREAAQEAITQIGLGSSFEHAIPLIEAACDRHNEEIADFREGWTAPAGKPWNERHPVLWQIMIALIAAAIGSAITAVIVGADATPTRDNSQARDIAPKVAPPRTPTELQSQNSS